MFTNEQLEIIHSQAAHRVVYAGPGSGKTAVLTNHLVALLHEGALSPSEICVMTFTRQAAGELKRRLLEGGSLTPFQVASLRIGTFHSLVFRMLIQMKVEVSPLLTESEQLRLIRSVMTRLGIHDKPHAWISELSKANASWPLASKGRKAQRMRASYEYQKQRAGRWDHDDVLLRFCERSESRDALCTIAPIQYMLIDEFQDTNAIQIHILGRLCEYFNAPLFAVGDEDQSIYGFRGASPAWLLKFPQMFVGAKQHYLSANFRSDESIVLHSDELIRHNKQRSGKRPVIVSGNIGICRAFAWKSEWLEAKRVADHLTHRISGNTHHESVAVLARTRAQLQHLARFVPQPVRGTVQFHTFHGSKGKEWDEVHVIGLVQHNPFTVDAGNRTDDEEERRLVYVAMTRSRHRLFLHVPLSMRGKRTNESHFVREAKINCQQGDEDGVDPFLDNML